MAEHGNTNEGNRELFVQDDVCLELRRFGGIECVVSNLLRLTQRREHPSLAVGVGMSTGATPGMFCSPFCDTHGIELGTALLACAVTELTTRSLHAAPRLVGRRRSADSTVTASRVVGENRSGTAWPDGQPNHDLVVSVEAREGWGLKTLAAVVEMLQGAKVESVLRKPANT